MAGGTAVNVFKFRMGDTPREVLNWRLWLAVFCFGLMGAARGVDEDLATGTFNSEAFQEQLGIANVSKVELANKKGTISSMVQLGSIAGALLWVVRPFLVYYCSYGRVVTYSRQCLCYL